MGSPNNGFERYHQSTIPLSPPKTGQEIIEAVRSVVTSYAMWDGNDYKFVQRYLRGKKGPLIVGVGCKFLPRNMVVLTWTDLSQKKIQPDAEYSEVAVGSTNWPGEITEDSFLYDQVVYEREVKVFVERIAEILSETA